MGGERIAEDLPVERSAADLLGGVAARFGHALHSAGVPVTPERSIRFATAVAAADPSTSDDVYWLGRVTLLTDREQVPVYDRVFNRIFLGFFDVPTDAPSDVSLTPPDPSRSSDQSSGSQSGQTAVDPGGHATASTPGSSSDEADDEHDPNRLAAVSGTERLAERSFSECTEDELSLIRRLIDRLPFVPPPRTGRRLRRHARGRRLDMRGTLRRSHRTAGDPVELVRRKRTERPRRVVLIADVSGSMEPYARIYLHLMRGAVLALGTEAFVFATRLTRLTRALVVTDPDTAYRRALDSAPDWAGGTRIGCALATFLDEHGRRGMARGAVVVIVSDGWEVESPELVGTSMERLSRLAHHVIWVNPRKAAESYEPLVGGMAAALPFVDTFVSGHSLRALEEVMAAISAARDRSSESTRHTRVSI